MKNFNGFSSSIATLAVGDVRGYCVLSNYCHIQILDVSHDLLNGFVSGPCFLFSPSPLPHLKSPLPLALKKAGRPDTQATKTISLGAVHNYMAYIGEYPPGHSARARKLIHINKHPISQGAWVLPLMAKGFHELNEICHYVRVGKSVKKNLFILEKRQASHSS